MEILTLLLEQQQKLLPLNRIRKTYSLSGYYHRNPLYI